MKILREIGKARIDKLQEDFDVMRFTQSFWPVDSFGRARIDLALAIIESKIALWQAICR